VRRAVWKGAAAVGLVFALAGPLFAAGVIATTPDISPGISMGGLVGLAVTWLGLLIAYLSLRRNQITDLDTKMSAAALSVFNEQMTARGNSFMDRGEQQAINASVNQRLDTSTNLTKLCGDIGENTRAVRELTLQIARGSDGKS
jgi:hypothetical protein